MTSSRVYSDRHLSPSSKVYELVGSRWVDQGTAYCAGQLDDANQAYLVARSELDFNKVILSTAIRSNDVYQRQQGMHISPCVFVEQSNAHTTHRKPDSMDGAQWGGLRIEFPGRRGMRGGVELHYRGPASFEFGRSALSSPLSTFLLSSLIYLTNTCLTKSRPEDQSIGSSSPGVEHSATTVNILRTGHLPTPQLGNIQDIEGAIKTLSRGQAVKEKICEYIQREVSCVVQLSIFRAIC